MPKTKLRDVDALKHAEKRAFIPSTEAEGSEQDNPLVRQKSVLELPKNPIVERGQDPELYWLDKYGKNDDSREPLRTDSPPLYRHEHIEPETLIHQFYRFRESSDTAEQESLLESFGNLRDLDAEQTVADYYKHSDTWKNRLILGDSLHVMASLLNLEGMAGKVQCIYIDPPYGIKYNSNWQMKMNDRTVKDGKDEHLSHEPEQIKAYRDTWELAIHSYLSYLRDRLLVARDLLTESGSCFVQISDENVHLVRCLMDEVFGSGNFVSLITVKKTAGLGTDMIPSITDYVIWYARNKEVLKYRPLFREKSLEGDQAYSMIQDSNGAVRRMTIEENNNHKLLPEAAEIFRYQILLSAGRTESCIYPIAFQGKTYMPTANRSWATNLAGVTRLIEKNRVAQTGTTLSYIRFANDFPLNLLPNFWDDTASGSGMDKLYVVQTNAKVIQRCLLMTTDPGDLVLDPTCGSGTTAFVAEQWGRRWITMDTSRIALNIAKARLSTAVFPAYYLYSDVSVGTETKNGKIKKTVAIKPQAERVSDVRQGFVYEEVPHITLKSLANDEPPDTETLYDRPLQDTKKFRVAGPFTVETLQSLDVRPPSALKGGGERLSETALTQRVLEGLRTAGIKNDRKDERMQFTRIDLRDGDERLHAEGFWQSSEGECKAYFYIGPQFGAVSTIAVSEAIKSCRRRKDADALVILGFAFESNIEGGAQTTSQGTFDLIKVRMNDDLLQEGLRKDPKAGSFITIGEPDIALTRSEDGATALVEIRGLDMYDPIRREARARDVEDIAYWMLDDDYDDANFVVRSMFFCGGDKDDYDAWKKKLDEAAKRNLNTAARRRAENTLRIELDDEMFSRIYGHESQPIEYRKGRRIAVKVISQFGEEAMKVLEMK
jgi:adenine-specific DNA-methyltransferase